MGNSFESLPNEKNDCGGGGGFFNIDLPGVGIVTADDDGDGEEDISASSRANFHTRGVRFMFSEAPVEAMIAPFNAGKHYTMRSLQQFVTSKRLLLTHTYWLALARSVTFIDTSVGLLKDA